MSNAVPSDTGSSGYLYPDEFPDRIVESGLKERAYYRKVTQKGAEFLDKVEPGWAALIDTATLDMSSLQCCIGGQIELRRYEPYSWGAFHRFCDRHFGPNCSLTGMRDLGFIGLCCGLDDELIELARMRAAWTEQIESRVGSSA